MKPVYLTFLLSIYFALKAYSCECGEGFSEFSPTYLFEYDHITKCRTIFVDTTKSGFRCRAVVLKNYWGTTNDTIEITTGRGDGDCGTRVELNTEYLLYGNGNANGFYISICNPARKLTNLDKNFKWESDSVYTSINFSTRYYSIIEIEEFLRKARLNEDKILEALLSNKNEEFITYFSDGCKSGTVSLKNGNLSGTCAFYYPNGLMMDQGNFVENKKSGAWNEYTYKKIRGTEFYFKESGSYVNGEKKGLWTKTFIKGTFKEYAAYRYGIKLSYDYGN